MPPFFCLEFPLSSAGSHQHSGGFGQWEHSLVIACTPSPCRCSPGQFQGRWKRSPSKPDWDSLLSQPQIAAPSAVLGMQMEPEKNIVFLSKSDFLLEIKGRKWDVNSECIAISLRRSHKLVKITEDSITAFITGHSAAAVFLMKCTDFLCSLPGSAQPLTTPGFQTAGGVCSCSALCPCSLSPSQPHWKSKTGNAGSLVLISYYRLCFGWSFSLIPTDWLWKWEQAHNVHHNRLKCQWSNGAKVLIYQLNVLFLLVQRGM